VLAAMLTLALPACGSASDEEGASGGETAARAGSGVGLKKIGTFESPVEVTGAPGFPKLLFVVEQGGRIQILENGRKRARPFLDIGGLIDSGGERGLLSLAFAPDYPRSKRFYVYYTDRSGAIRVDEFRRRSATRAAFGSRRPVIRIPHPVNANHNGGDPPNNAQNKDVLLGKLLRIDPRAGGGRPYSVPADNPFVGRPGRDEIYSYGLRNPFRFSFDLTHGAPRIAIGDVGQNQFEEVDYTTVAKARGANFGWDAFEGFHTYEDESSGTPDPGDTIKPILAYPHSRGGSCSIIGGYVVRDPRLKSLRGRYVYADLCEGQLRSLVPHLKKASGDRKLGLQVDSPTSFGEDQQHRLYVTSLEGPVYRLIPR
jgi:glucose/arabinose dehydrogenase